MLHASAIDRGILSVHDTKRTPVGEESAARLAGQLADIAGLQLGEGPCIDAIGRLDTVDAPDLTEGGRWPRFGPLAVKAGLRSVLGYRLFAGSETLGALQLYARLPAAFNAARRD